MQYPSILKNLFNVSIGDFMRTVTHDTAAELDFAPNYTLLPIITPSALFLYVLVIPDFISLCGSQTQTMWQMLCVYNIWKQTTQLIKHYGEWKEMSVPSM